MELASGVGVRCWWAVRVVLCGVGGVLVSMPALGAVAAYAQPVYTVLTPSVRVRAVGQPGQPQPLVSLNITDSTLDYALHEVAQQAHMQLLYNSHRLTLSQRVTIHVIKAHVADVLAAIFKGTGLTAQIGVDGETIIVHEQGAEPARNISPVAGGIIVGRVADSTTGAGLRGAQVRVEGLPKLSAVTSDSGNFTLRDVPPGDQVLQVRLFGYRPVTRTVTVTDSERTTVRIAMVPVPTVLSGVVTTATGVQRKIEVGNDITSLNVDSIMKVAPISTVTDLLETRVPGLTVLRSSGVPGNPSRIRIRGASSILGNNDPIVIVDGIRVYASQSDARNNNLAPALRGGGQNPTFSGNTVASSQYAAPSPLDQIDPNDIETIEVLKGPSASSMYGSDAANGVIVVTTKHGRAGPTHWSLNVGEGVNWLPGQWPVNYFPFGSNPVNVQFGSPSASVFCAFGDVGCVPDSVVTFQALNDPRFTVFSHGHDQTASLTVSGGVPTLTYSLTGTAAGDVGNLKLPAIEEQRFKDLYGPIPNWMVRPDNYQHQGLSGTLSARPYPALSVTLQSSLFNSTQQQGSLQQAITQLQGEYINPLGVLPFGTNTVGNPNDGFLSLGSVPLISNDVERATAASLTATNALTVNWQPYAWLPINATTGVSTVQRTDQTYIPYGINPNGPGGICTNSCSDTTGWYGLGRGASQDLTVNVGTSIPTLHNRLTLGLGGNFHAGSTADFTVSTNQLAPGVSSPTSFVCSAPGSLSGLQPCPSSQGTSALSTYGWYVEPRFNIASRFFVAPGFRLDGGSATGARVSTNAGGVSIPGVTGFPKIDFSYLAVDQSRPRGILTLLRPRLAFGYAGTQPAQTDKLRLFTNVNTINAGVVPLNDTTILPIVAVQTLGNSQLLPEQSSELEGGLDAELWHGRLAITYTQYNKTVHNAITQVPVAPSVSPVVQPGDLPVSSFSNFVSLGGLGAYYTNIAAVRNTGTNATLNIRLLESRAVSWNIGANLSNNNSVVEKLGFGRTSIFLGPGQFIRPGYPLFAQWARPIVSFVDVNHDKFITPDEIRYGDSLVYVGQPEPKYQANLNTGVTVLDGRLSVNASFAYQNGMTQTNTGGGNSGLFGQLLGQPGVSLATQAAVQAYLAGVTPIGLVQTVNTFRFNDLSINYTLPTGLAHWFRVPRMSVALQGSNLGLHTNYRGKDPNVNAFSTVSAGDETGDLGQLPQPRVWWLRLNLGN